MRRLFIATMVILALMAPSASAVMSIPENSPTFIISQLEEQLAKEKKLNDQLQRDNKRLKRLLSAQKRKTDSYRLKYLAKKRWWTEADIRFVATKSASRYHLKGAKRTWAIEACVYTAKREAGKKWADKKHTKYLYSTYSVKPGGRAGLHQWGTHWKGSKADKTNGVWSCRRFMRVVRDGGKSKVIQHWEQTIGPWRNR